MTGRPVRWPSSWRPGFEDEIAAVDWVVAPQRVTALRPYDLDVYGWDGGPLVRFSVRGGRLSTWRERTAVDTRRAARLTGGTPANGLSLLKKTPPWRPGWPGPPADENGAERPN